MSTSEQTTAIPTGTWQADTVHSKLGFEVPYAVSTFGGDVTDFEATLADGTLTGAGRVETLQVKDEQLKAHLMSPEFFDAERHPEVTFVSTAIRRDGDSVEVDGDLTLKGITKPVTLTGTATGPTVDHFGSNRIGFALQTTIDRTQFGMNWNMPLPNGEPALANDVTLKADLTLVGQ
ncbi:MAG TPA: YceI family protein [Gaiellaceae bacterium]|nr:YceI family protein [Gaiellaceae bacterium]